MQSKAFYGLHNLIHLNITAHYVSSLKSYIFYNLLNLQELFLIGSAKNYFPSKILQDAKNLEYLSVSNNSYLTELPSQFCANMLQLETVVIEDNGIHRLPEDLFLNSSGIITILLRKNKLMNLPENIFYGLLNLQKLDLSSNEIIQLSDDVFFGLFSLTQLDLSNNNIKSFNK